MLEKIKKLLKKEPNLKAREIARKLGFDRTTVSSLMHKHKDTAFQQNDEYEWSLMPDELEVTFDDHWVTCASFESSLSSVNLDSVQKVKFIFPMNCKFLLEAIARFLALCNQLIADEKEVTIDLSNNSGSSGYWNRVGFFDHLHEDVNVLPERPKTSTAKSRKGKSKNLVEFGAVAPKSENKELVKQLADAFVALSSDNYQDPAFTIFSELIGNVKEHSETDLNGFAALQKYDGYSGKKPHIQTVVSDSGVGIAATLRPILKDHYPKLSKLSDIELVKKAMSEGQISKHGSSAESGHGMGFKSSKEKAVKFNARYSVRQSNFGLDFRFKDGKLQPVKEQTDLIKISGTHICFDFEIDEPGSAD